MPAVLAPRLLSERRYGTFRRQLPRPEGVNAEQVTASFKDSVLV